MRIGFSDRVWRDQPRDVPEVDPDTRGQENPISSSMDVWTYGQSSHGVATPIPDIPRNVLSIQQSNALGEQPQFSMPILHMTSSAPLLVPPATTNQPSKRGSERASGLSLSPSPFILESCTYCIVGRRCRHSPAQGVPTRQKDKRHGPTRLVSPEIFRVCAKQTI